MKRFAVIGLGAFGSWVARALTRSGFDVISIDRDAGRVDRFAHEVARAVVGDASDTLVLRKNGVADVDAATIAVTRSGPGADLWRGAAAAVAVAAVVNTLVKLGLALGMGAPAFRKPVTVALGGMAAVGAAAAAIVYWT